MVADPKPTRETNKNYLAYIKTLHCLCKNSACTGDIAPHHVFTRGSGGSDYETIPLCAYHHNEAHNTGRNTFARKYIMDYTEEFLRCLVGYIKRLEGE